MDAATCALQSHMQGIVRTKPSSVHVDPQMRQSGRALLPPGVDGRIVIVRDDEPTSLIAYALSTRCALAPRADVTSSLMVGNLNHILHP